ncbi:MAG: InlB B-repeat-containing protein [Acholeplasmataceae bacterium]
MAPFNKITIKDRIKIPLFISIISILAIILFVIIRIENNQINRIKIDEIVEFYQGDSFNNVSNDITLKEKVHHFNIKWESLNAVILSDSGKINPLPYDETVEVTALVKGVFVRRKIPIYFNISGNNISNWMKVTYPQNIKGFINGEPIDNDKYYPVGTTVDFVVDEVEDKNAVVFVNGEPVDLDDNHSFQYLLGQNIEVTIHYLNKDNIIVVYNPNGGLVNNQKILIDVINLNTTIEGSYLPVKEGYLFKHWSSDGRNPYDFNTKITNNLFLYAVYEPVVKTHKITFNKPIMVTKNNQPIVSNTNIAPDDKLEVLIPYNQELYQIRFLVNNLKTELDLSVPNLGIYQINNPNSNINLAVEFIPKKVNVTFNLLGGTINNSELLNQEINAGTKLNAPKPTKNGYIFKYWSVTENGTTQFNLESPVYQNITLYAIYEPIPYVLNTSDNNGEIVYKVNDEVLINKILKYQDKLTIELNLQPNQRLIEIKVLMNGVEIILQPNDFIDNKYEIIVNGDITIISNIEIDN